MTGEPDLGMPQDLSLPSDGGSDGGSDGSVSAPDLATTYVQQPGCSKDAWCWMFPQPQGNTLWSVWGSSATDVWAGGESGSLLHYVDGSWQNTISPAPGAIRGLWGTDKNNVFRVGDRGTVLRYDGTRWNALALPAVQPKRVTTLYGVFGQSPTDVWFVGTGGVALHYDGATMTETSTPDLGTLRAVWGPSATSMYAVSSLGAGIEVLHFDPVAKSWSVMATIPTTSDPTSLWGTAENDFFVGGSGGDIFHYGGATFATAHPLANYGINALWGSGTKVFAVGDVQYTDLVTHDPTVRKGSLLQWNGTTFTEVPGAPRAGFFGLWGSSASDLFLVGTSGTIAHFDGTAFSTTSLYEPLTGVGAPMTGLGSNAAGDLIVVGDYGATLTWNGTAWSSTPSNPHVRFRGAAGGTSLFAIAKDLTVTTGTPAYSWTGTQWLAETVPAAADLRAVTTRGTLALAVGAADLVLQRNGTSWTPATVQSAGTTVLRAVFAVDATHIWVVGGGDLAENPTLNPARALFSSNGTTYQPVSVPVTEIVLRGVWGSAPGDVWAVGDSGTMLHFNGTAWLPVTLPKLTTLRAIWGRDATTVYAAGDAGTLLRWDGTDWKAETSGTSNSFISLWGTEKDVYALGTNGMVLHKSLR